MRQAEMIRRLFPLLSLALSLAIPGIASAQGQAGPFDNCKISRQTNTGQTEMNREQNTGFLGVAVEIECDDVQLFAEEVRWDAKKVYASGKLLFVHRGDGLTVYAERAEMDRETKFGTFFNAQGFARLSEERGEPTPFGTMEPDIQFQAEKFERIGQRTYRLTRGKFSTCDQPTPRWVISGSSGTVELDHHVSLRNAVLKVKDVPLLYLPYMYYPINKDKRSTGFLLPSYGASSTLGSGLTNYFFLVLGRSMDATFYHTWQSKAGQTFATEYQFVSAPGSRGDALFKVISNKAQYGDDGTTVVRPANRSYNIRGGTSQALPRGFYFIGNINYFTSIEDQQRYEQNFYDQSNRSRYFGGNLSGTIARWYRLSTRVEQTDYYSRGVTGATVASRQGRLPQVNVTMTDRPLGRSRVYLGGFGDVASLIQQGNIDEPASDHSLLRFDASPRVRASLSTLPFLSVATTGSWRITHWRASVDPVTREQVPEPMTRNVVELRADALGPVVSRVFQPQNNGYAERFKHLIEPRFTVQWISPYRHQDQIVPNEWGVDTLVTGTTNLSYSLTNRLLARRRGVAGAPGTVRDILSVSISQTRYTNALAAQYDNNYQLAAANAFSPLRIDVRVSTTDTLGGNFRMAIDPKFKTPQYYSAGGSWATPSTQVNAAWSKTMFIPGSPQFTALAASHFLQGSTTMRRFDGRVTGTYSIYFDVKQLDIVQQRIVASYSAQCCGVTVDYQRLRRPQFATAVPGDERRFSISFSLAGIGSFSNPFGSFGDNTGSR
jgi:lipopolysaccharide assembly outer membrane protein LptD (OstA)